MILRPGRKKNKKLFPAILLLVLWAQPAAAGDNSGCSSTSGAPVKVAPVFEEPHYDFSRDLGAIQALAKDSHHSIPEALTMGLTRYEPVIELHIAFKVKTMPGHLSCAQVERSDVTVGYRNVSILIANEIPQNSCGFNLVMAHEEKHIEVNRHLLKDYVPIIEERLTSYLKANGAFPTTSADAAEQSLRKNLTSVMGALLADMEHENTRWQMLVDSPEEYHRVSAACDGQLAQIAKQFQGAEQ